MRKHRMNTNTKRMVLAAIAAFYVVVGGLWATNFFPLQKFYNQTQLQHRLHLEHGYYGAKEINAWKKAEEYKTRYVLTHRDLLETEEKIALYMSILMWGTLALGVSGGVFFFGRSRDQKTTETNAPK
jgi:hypothetical protein